MLTEQTTSADRSDDRIRFANAEYFTLIDVVNDSIRINKPRWLGHRVHVVRHFHALPTIWSERPKVLQIFSALFSAVGESISKFARPEVKLTVRVETQSDLARVEIEVEGLGVPRERLPYSHSPARGELDWDDAFHLQHSAVIAAELGGTLIAAHADEGCLISFCLELPLQPKGDGQA
jgi:C4-dicarboxylate-specific signal transduction histidine kinase